MPVLRDILPERGPHFFPLHINYSGSVVKKRELRVFGQLSGLLH